MQLLANDSSDNLNLTLSVLADGKFRIQITEESVQRYQLEDVLDGEPEKIRFKNLEASKDGHLKMKFDDYDFVINIEHFVIEFHLNNGLQVVFDGSYLHFDKNLDKAFTFGVSFPNAPQLYGLHEHADRLALQTTKPGGPDPYRLRNLDVAGYELNSPMALYGAIPVLYSHGYYDYPFLLLIIINLNFQYYIHFWCIFT